jgi:hypothetical protein
VVRHLTHPFQHIHPHLQQCRQTTCIENKPHT